MKFQGNRDRVNNWMSNWRIASNVRSYCVFHQFATLLYHQLHSTIYIQYNSNKFIFLQSFFQSDDLVKLMPKKHAYVKVCIRLLSMWLHYENQKSLILMTFDQEVYISHTHTNYFFYGIHNLSFCQWKIIGSLEMLIS